MLMQHDDQSSKCTEAGQKVTKLWYMQARVVELLIICTELTVA